MNSKTSFNIGNVCIGGQNPVVVQSMTNTDTNDVAASVAQVGRMVDAGAQMVRLTVPSLKEVEAMRAIRERLRAEGIAVPLVADVHFNPKVAEAMASIVEKVRINPGNYVDKRNFSQLDLSDAEYAAAVERMALRAEPLLRICREHGTAIRLGINHGSLCDRIVSRYGNTPNAMVQSALEWLDICEQYDFHKVVVSMKSSNVHTMMEATLTLHQEMERRGRSYPLHLGVTEAGNGLEARVKSAAGIGALLLMGAGDTVRVSLTEPPENETPFAHKLVSAVQQLSVNDCSVQGQTLTFASEEQDYETWVAQTSAMAGLAYYNHHIRDVKLANHHFTPAQCTELEAVILQACGIRMSKTEFISCPSCGRTQYDIQSVLSVVKERFSGHPGLKIGVMGCIVNGPGEMADADYGIVGASNGLVCVYEGKKRLTAAITIEEAMSHLETLLENKMD
ncbi:MAG: (E)-4-hydroxy-3-methylbut-2-enyl-diphosphate synthase [Bacteroidales bacterium]|nr:(E)-4-hydroxy-3-methylbut-2-enyl-diphosphate synthase [Bacteroidales bacterium]